LQEAFFMGKDVGLVALVATLAGAAIACVVAGLSPDNYTATAAVMLPEGAGAGSRVVRIRHAAGDPQAAAGLVNGEVEDFRRRKAIVLDSTLVVRRAPDYVVNSALGAVGGLALALGVFFFARGRRRPLRTENDFVRTLGQPLLAARPLRIEGLEELCQQLLEHWFTGERRLLPVVSAEPGDGRSSVASEMAKRFAAMGEKVLLVDADLRSPSLHSRFGLRNQAGLADFLDGRGIGIAACSENLGLVVAGCCPADPLHALSSQRLPAFLAEAGKHFRVVLIDTPAAARGPDLQMPAALAGGALVVARPGEAHAPALERLHAALKGASARVVATLINRG
jgi:Mrp family chromosome partitioning ATPase